MRYRDDSNGVIYFIHSVGAKAVKIGFCYSEARLKTRLGQLQVSSPCPLELICYIPGTREGEKFFHKFLADYNLSGEWFSLDRSVRDTIWRVCKETGQMDQYNAFESSMRGLPSELGYSQFAVDKATILML